MANTLLQEYIIALTNLYGMVHRDKVVEIFNRQNQDKITVDDIANVSEVELDEAFVYPYKEFFVHEAIIEFEDCDQYFARKADKPYYVPDKRELLLYAEESYFEETKEYKALLNYVRKHFFADDRDLAVDLCEDIHVTCQLDFDTRSIFECLNRFGVDFQDRNQLNELMKLVMNLANNIRIWENNGHTPREIFEKYERPNLRPIQHGPFVDDATNVVDFQTKKKVGRNDPCPCGSGKKFKRCCLGMDTNND